MKKNDTHIFTGMQRDFSVSKQKPEFLWEAHNIRITARGKNTLMSITNEKGTSEITTIGTFLGTFLGYCVINNYLIVFTTQNGIDRIYRVNKEENYTSTILYQGNLNFSVNHAIETLGIYESEFIQKVYWTDGFNQPRLINITKDLLYPNITYNPSSFNFVQELQLKERINVYKESSNLGIFPAGVLQYALTYYNKYGQESNIAWVSDLLYTSYPNRAGSPEDKIGNAFRININNYDSNFEFARLYSIFRTSINSTPIVKRVKDIELSLNSDVNYHIQGSVNIRYYDSCQNPALVDVYLNNSKIGNLSTPILDMFPKARRVTITINLKCNNDTIGYLGPGDYYMIKKSDYRQLELKCSSGNFDSGYPIITWSSGEYMLLPIDITYGITGGGYYLGTSFTLSNGETYSGQLLVTTNGYFSSSQLEINYIDTNNDGDIIDPTLLLYVGGEEILAQTLAQKDSTLFLGNIEIKRKAVSIERKKYIQTLRLHDYSREIVIQRPSTDSFYNYYNTLDTKNALNGYTVDSRTFKSGEYYRFGIQFQHKNGKWSEPIFLENKQIRNKPYLNVGNLRLPTMRFIHKLSFMKEEGYIKARGLVVLPTTQERTIVAQGILSPSVYNIQDRLSGTPYAQSSWFLRPFPAGYGEGIVSNSNDYNINLGSQVQFRHYHALYSGWNRGSEIQNMPKEFSGALLGESGMAFRNQGYNNELTPFGSVAIRHGSIITDATNFEVIENKNWSSVYGVDQSILSFYSPDVEFDDTFNTLDYSNLNLDIIGQTLFTSTSGDIDIQTSTPPISYEGAGFIHRSMSAKGVNSSRSLVAGLFYSDYLVDDLKDGKFQPYDKEKNPFLYMVYPWNKSGSLNNDINRPADKGTRSAVLKQKKISNLKFSINNVTLNSPIRVATTPIQLFNSNQVEVIKVPFQSKECNYYGNVDSIIGAMSLYGSVFSANPTNNSITTLSTPTFTDLPLLFSTKKGIIKTDDWFTISTDSGDYTGTLRATKEMVRMKYKSSPHVVIGLKRTDLDTIAKTNSSLLDQSLPYLFLAELKRDYNPDTMFGGTSEEAIKYNIWIPAGPAVNIEDKGDTIVQFYWGDTWYQRYDVLKTYPFTQEDENSIIEIGSFLCESRVNIDGRYDRNRGQSSNLNISNTNFNLLNKVYSQTNNFFNYRVLDSDYYKINSFPTSVIWSKEKTSSSDIDIWTNITMANQIDLDGQYGHLNAIKTYKDQIFTFQDSAISNIIFNPRVQIPTSDGVPIEISNNYKVEGSRYITTSIGCKNKYSIVEGTSGLYFIDSISSSLYSIGNEGLKNISSSLGMNNWFVKLNNKQWIPNNYTLKSFYDKKFNDLYIVNSKDSLVFSDLLGQFTSFMSYENSSAMFNIGNDFYSIYNGKLWKLFSGNENNIYGNYQPFSITFVSNADSYYDKIFTNVDVRADFYSNNLNISQGGLCIVNTSPILEHNQFFDYIKVDNEYQNTNKVPLKLLPNRTSILKKKFRTWRIDIPRSSRIGSKTQRDRIRNNWTYITLGVENQDTLEKNISMELHDINVIYYIQ